MAGEQQIGDDMVVRLTGDGTEYEKMLAKAADATKKTESEVAKSTKTIEDFGKSLTSFGDAVVGALTSSFAGKFLSKAFDEFKGVETGQIKLKAAIEGNGGAVEETVARYNKYAGVLKDTLGVGKAESMQLLKQAEVFGLTGKQAENATQKSLALASATDTDAQSVFRFVSAMEKGDIKLAMQWKRMIPAMREAQNEEQLLERYGTFVSIGQKTLAAEMNSSAGVLKRYEGAVKGLTKQFGDLITSAVLPVVKYATELIDQFTKLDERTKKLIIGLTLFTAAILSIGPVVALVKGWLLPFLSLSASGFTLLSFAVKYLGGVLLSLFSGAVLAKFALLSIPIAILGTVLTAVAQKFGGFKAMYNSILDRITAAGGGLWETIKTKALVAWDYIQARISDFVEWMKPIIGAAIGIVDAAWEGIKSVAIAVWDVVSTAAVDAWVKISETAVELWKNLTGGASVTWKDIQDVIVLAMIKAEFVLRNLLDVSKYVWMGIKLQAITTFNEIMHWSTSTLPAAFKYMIDNSQAIIGSFLVWWIESAKISADTVKDILAGNVFDIKDKVKAALARINNISAGGGLSPFIAPARITGELEAKLRKEFDEMGEKLDKDWEAFKTRRLEEIGAFEWAGGPAVEAMTAAEKAGGDLGKSFNKGAKEEMKGLDAVLAGSAESYRRLAAYRDRITEPREKSEAKRKKAREEAMADVGPAALAGKAGVVAPALPAGVEAGIIAPAPPRIPGDVGDLTKLAPLFALAVEKLKEIAANTKETADADVIPAGFDE